MYWYFKAFKNQPLNILLLDSVQVFKDFKNQPLNTLLSDNVVIFKKQSININFFTKYNVSKVIYLFYKKQTTLINYLISLQAIMIRQGKEIIQIRYILF